MLTARHLAVSTANQIVPNLAPIGGTLDGLLTLRGTPADPVLRTHWTLAGAAFATIRDVQTDLDATYNDGRWTSRVSVSAPKGMDLETTIWGQPSPWRICCTTSCESAPERSTST